MDAESVRCVTGPQTEERGNEERPADLRVVGLIICVVCPSSTISCWFSFGLCKSHNCRLVLSLSL